MAVNFIFPVPLQPEKPVARPCPFLQNWRDVSARLGTFGGVQAVLIANPKGFKFAMVVLKRTKSNSIEDLRVALGKFIALLEQQDEFAAAKDLTMALNLLQSAKPNSTELMKSLQIIKVAFDDEHELVAYTHHRKTDDWTDREELATASTRVLNLTNRLMGQESP